ncbi:uncharacterized protein STEHIDRAFT_162122 [Stereum hirsutum FP-91666 SS1]|uniref:uncharacterized protein n=1 Tax=Stereum hirsutum (strain FP-91666) TaxID=721885 RepID=UPI0004449ECB|nr:uncharacterized protein STEHIDRAFT_162122 [Stereum hirsutum FP-91666 SS1]EIM81128.1 hypothetical protein STEHIDRAFT_162122 [Stereum hirsutum FP-91666 SS1]
MPARIHNATLRNESDLIYPPVPAGVVPGEGILPKTKLDLVILAGTQCAAVSAALHLPPLTPNATAMEQKRQLGAFFGVALA